jgi:hypothetical protein
MRDNADEQMSNRHLEVYLLWLFGYVMFYGSQGDAVSRFLTPHAERITDATVEEMPKINRGTVILVAMYMGLCAGCTKTGTHSILLGCPLLLHLWSYERLPVGRPSIDRSPYRELEEGHDPADRPTMGLMWCQRQVRTSS